MGCTLILHLHSKFINYLLSLLMLVLLAYIVAVWIPASLAKFIYTAHDLPVTVKS